MRPWLVFASQPRVSGPVSCTGAVHVCPPSADELKPTSSWQVAALQLEALEKQATASAQFIGEAVETRDVDGLRTLWEKGANLSRSNAEQAVALSQEVLAITQKTAESVSALVQEQRQAANDAVASPIVTGRKVSSAK